MKKKIFSWVLLASLFTVQFARAQSEAVVTGVAPEQFKPVVLKVLRDNNYDIANDNTNIETGWKEYTVNMVLKYRAKLSCTYADGTIKIAFMTKQALGDNGVWIDPVIPSKKADDKMVNTLAEGIKKILADPAAVAAAMTAQPPAAVSQGSGGSKGGGVVVTAVKSVSSSQSAKVPSTANAKELQCHPDDAYEFREGFCAIKKHDLWGFIDTKGNVTVDFKYGSPTGLDGPYYSGGIAMVAEKKDGMNVPKYIDTKGLELFKTVKIVWGTPFEGGIALFGKGNSVYTASYTFYNKQGQPLPGSVVCTSSLGIKNHPFSEGLAKFYDSKTSSWGYINQQAKWAIMPKYNEVGEFSDGMAPVQNKTNYYWGYINNKGAEVVPFDYKTKPGPFSDGLAAVKNSKEDVGYIDKSGNVVIPFKFNGYNTNGPFRNGHAVVYLDGRGYILIDKAGNEVRWFNTTKVYVYKNGWIGWFHEMGNNVTFTWGIVTPDGKDVLVPGYFKSISEFSDGLAWATAEIDGKEITGFINESFDFVIIQTAE